MKFLYTILVFLISSFALATELPNFPFVVSSGKAEIEVKPDEAKIQLGVMAFDKSSDLATSSVAKASNNVLKILETAGVTASKIEASDLRKSTTRAKDSKYNRLDILGYEVSRTFAISVEDLTNYSELMLALVEVDNVTDINTSFDYSKRDEIKADLMVKAGRNARETGEDMAKALGVEVHSVYAISKVSDFDGFFATFGAFSGSLSTMYDSSGSSGLSMFVPEYIIISQHVNVVFRLKEN